MATTFKVRPVMALLNCPVMRPDRITPIHDEDVEQGIGAVGVGSAATPDGDPMLFLSLHQPDGAVLMAHLTPEEGARIARLLTGALHEMATFVPGQRAEAVN